MAREFTIRNINGQSRRITVPGDGPVTVVPVVEPVASVVSVPEPAEEDSGYGFDLD